MEKSYPVIFAGEKVGQVHIEPQGLYAQVDCQCNLSGEVVMELVALRGGHPLKLGVLVPDENGFGIRTRCIRKLLPEDTAFILRPRHHAGTGKHSSVAPETPHAYLKRMEMSFLLLRELVPETILSTEKL